VNGNNNFTWLLGKCTVDVEANVIINQLVGPRIYTNFPEVKYLPLGNAGVRT
jgi:hypothetical protein